MKSRSRDGLAAKGLLGGDAFSSKDEKPDG